LGPSCVTAEKIAVRSAQFVIPYDAFSTLQPAKILPLEVSIAAPTRNLEYGACAFFMAFFAEPSSRSLVSAGSVFLRMVNNHRYSKERIVRHCKPGKNQPEFFLAGLLLWFCRGGVSWPLQSEGN